MTSSPIPVLIVDDDPSVGAWLQLLVRRMGNNFPCEVKWVTSGTIALEELAKADYELVLLDYRLKDTDGLSVLSLIQELPREHRPEVIMLTGGGSEEIAVEAMKRGARDYLVKGSLDQSTMRRAMSGALDHRRLEQQLAHSNEELRSKNAQMEAELVMAREVQQALLPQQYPVFPRGVAPAESKLRFAHRWIPSSGMAGDFFEVIPVSDDIAGVFLCDVMGHGVRAALVTALIRGLMEEMMPYANDPGAFLRELNNHLKTILQRSNNVLFATAIYLVADVAKGELRMANAAHPNPLLLRKAGSEVSYWQGDGGPDPALGLIQDVDYTTHTMKVGSGDSVMLFTDGLYEAENDTGEAYGLKRLEEVVRTRLQLPDAKLFDSILGDIRSFLQVKEAAVLSDDICMVHVELA